MFYLISMFISIALFVAVISFGKKFDHSIILLSTVVAISSAGHYCVSAATNHDELVLAIKLSYATGIYAPMFTFLIICTICRINIPNVLRFIMIFIQTALYIGVFTIGKYPFFYKSVDLIVNGSERYLKKSYGPLHTAYLFTMVLYVFVSVIVAMMSLKKKNTVSKLNVEIILFALAMTVTLYLVERFTRLDVELMPGAFAISMCLIMIPLVKIYTFSIYDNEDIVKDRWSRTGYIVFDKKLRYMGCNDFATQLFPELEQWELEKKIPGNGGRFNTFLRQPLMTYVNDQDHSDHATKLYEHQDENYSCDIRPLRSSKDHVIGYYVQISNVTDLIKGQG